MSKDERDMSLEELQRAIEEQIKSQLRAEDIVIKELLNAGRILANKLWQQQNLVLYECPLCDKPAMGHPGSVVYCECGHRAERFMS